MKSAIDLWGKGEAVAHAGGGGYTLDRWGAVEMAKRGSVHSQVATLALTGMLFLFSRMANTRMKYSTPGSSSRMVADVWSPGTRNCISRPSSWVGVYTMRYSVTRISLSQARFTVSSVTSVTMRSLGGDTGRNKEGQLGSDGVRNTLYGWQQGRTWWVCILEDLGPLGLAGGRDRSSLLWLIFKTFGGCPLPSG